MYKALAAAALAMVCISSLAADREKQEQGLLQAYPHIFSRKDLTLTVSLRNGGKTEFTSIAAKRPQEDEGEYWLDAYYPDIHYALIRSSYWLGEGQGFDLLDLNSGKTVEVGGFPVLSPDKTRFAVEMEDISAGYFENLLAVYKITSRGLVLEFKLAPKEWGISDIHWINKLHLTFNKKSLGPNNEILVQEKSLAGKESKQGKVKWTIQ